MTPSVQPSQPSRGLSLAQGFLSLIRPKRKTPQAVDTGVTIGKASAKIGPLKSTRERPQLLSEEAPPCDLKQLAAHFDNILKVKIAKSSEEQRCKIQRWTENEKKIAEEVIQSIQANTFFSQIKSPAAFGALALGIFGTALQLYLGGNENPAATIFQGAYTTLTATATAMQAKAQYKIKMTEIRQFESSVRNQELQDEIALDEQYLQEFTRVLTDVLSKLLKLQEVDAEIKSTITHTKGRGG